MTETPRHETRTGRPSAIVRGSSAAAALALAALITGFSGGAASASTLSTTTGADAVVVSNLQTSTSSVSATLVAGPPTATPPTAPPPQGPSAGGSAALLAAASDDTTDYVPDGEWPDEGGVSSFTPDSPSEQDAGDQGVGDEAPESEGLAFTGADAGLIAVVALAFIVGGALVAALGASIRRRATKSRS